MSCGQFVYPCEDLVRSRNIFEAEKIIEAGMIDSRTYSDAVIKDRIRALMETVNAVGRERGKAV